MKMYPLLH